MLTVSLTGSSSGTDHSSWLTFRPGYGLRQHHRSRGRHTRDHGRRPEDAFLAVEPLLRRLGRTVTRVGTNGQALLVRIPRFRLSAEG
jgi:hypothetical protein